MVDKKLLARIEAAGLAVIEALSEAERLTSGAYQTLADTLAEAYGKDWFTLETKSHKTAEEKKRLEGLKESRKGFTAQAKERGINANSAWQNVKAKHQPKKKKKDAGSTAPRMLETFTLESIPPALRRAAKDDDLDTPEYVLAFWSDVEAAFIKRFPKMTRTKIHGEG